MKTINKKDIFLISSILILATGFFIWQYISTRNYTDLYAAIRLNGEIVKTITLDYNTDFSLEQRPNVHFQIRNRQIAFVKADCPDHVCINTGFIGFVGQTAACLPNGLIVYVRGQDQNQETIDIII